MSQTTQPVFEPRSGDTWRDPFAMYQALRDHDPVHHVRDNGEGEDYWVLSRFEHVFNSAVDAGSFSSASGLTFSYGEMEKLRAQNETPIVMMDPPEHTSLRKLSIKNLTPQRVEALAPMLREFVVERVERLRDMDGGDVIEELFKPLPSLVVSHFLGVPREDREHFDRWTGAIVSAAGDGNVLGAADAVGEMMGYFMKLIEKRKSDPGQDMISALVHNRLANGDEVSLPKILGIGFTMVTGGNDTATGLLGGASELLTRNPGQRARLLQDLGGLNEAINEFLRLTSPVQGLARTTIRDIEIDGTTIPEGRKVMLLYASANRDPREYGPDAEECDVSRRFKRHLAFSYGPHFCIGAAAARLQTRIALQELLTRCPEFAVDWEAGEYAPGHFVRRYKTLPFHAKGLS